MSLDVDVKVEAPGAIQTIAGVEAALGKVEVAGPRAGAAVSAGLETAATAAEKATASAKELADQFTAMSNAGSNAFGGGLADQFKREADMLEKINGPAKEYAANLAALDGLQMKNMISTQQYADEVTKLNKALNDTPAPKEGGEGAGLGGTMEAIGGAAAGLGIIELGKGIAELIESSEQLEGQYIKLTNTAQLFTDANHSVNDVLAEQSKLSEDLGSTMGPTMDLYNRVREGADGLNLSRGEQLSLTKALGDATALSNKPLDAAGGVMQRLAFAMETGTLDARTLHQTMLQLPALAKEWTKTLGLTEAQIISMTKNGKLGVRDLIDATLRGGKDLEELHDKLIKVAPEVEQAQALERLNVAHQQQGSSIFKSSSFGDMIAANNIKRSDIFGESDEEQAAKAQTFFAELAEQIQKGTGNFKALGDARRASFDGMIQDVEAVGNGFDKLVGGISLFTSKLGLAKDAWDDGQLHGPAAMIGGVGTGMKTAMDAADKIGKAKQELADLDAAYGKGAVSALAYRSAHESLLTTIAGGESVERKMANEIADGARAYTEGMAAAIDMNDRGTISAKNYYAQLDKISKAHGDGGFKDYYDNNTALGSAVARRNGGNFVDRVGMGSFADDENQSSFQETIDKTKPATADPDDAKRLEMYKAIATPAEKYADELAEINRLYDGNHGDAYNRVLGALQDKYTAIKTPAEAYAASVKKLDQEMGTGLVSLAAYDDAMRNLRLTSGQGTIADGMIKGMKDFEKEANDVGNQVAGTFKKMTDGMNQNIISFVTTGKSNFSGLATSIEQDFLQMALKKAEAALFSGFGGGDGESSGDAASQAMDIGKMFAGGFATGGGFDYDSIPGAADGFSGVATGSGGTDSKLAMFRITPGEHVSIQTPEQQGLSRQGSQSSAQAPAAQVHVHLQNDKRDLLSAMNSNEGTRQIVRLNRKLGR